jgi:hypothetical protein
MKREFGTNPERIMARRPFRLTNLPVAALVVAAAGLSAAALMLGNGDAVVERGFERALASMADQPQSAKTTASGLAGNGQFWLTHVVHDAGATFTKPVAVGDRITIASGGRERNLRVVDVAKLDSSIVPASSERPAPLLLVTCRDEASPTSRPVRLLIEADDEAPALSSAKAARTL